MDYQVSLSPGPAELFARMVGAPLVDFGVDLLGEFGGDHIAELVEAGLVEPLTERRYQLHGLVRGRVDEGVLRTVVDFYLVRAVALDHAVTDVALAWFADERTNLLPLTRAAMAAGLYKEVWRLGEALISFYFNRPYLTDWLELTHLAIEAASECDNPVAEARLRTTITLPLMGLGRFKQVAEQLEQAQALAERSGNQNALASVWESRGRYLHRINRDTAAADAYRTAIELYRRAYNKRGEARVRDLLTEPTLADLRAVVDTLARKGMLGPLVEAREALARVHDERGDAEAASEQRRLAQQIIDEHS